MENSLEGHHYVFLDSEKATTKELINGGRTLRAVFSLERSSEIENYSVNAPISNASGVRLHAWNFPVRIAGESLYQWTRRFLFLRITRTSDDFSVTVPVPVGIDETENVDIETDPYGVLFFQHCMRYITLSVFFTVLERVAPYFTAGGDPNPFGLRLFSNTDPLTCRLSLGILQGPGPDFEVWLLCKSSPEPDKCVARKLGFSATRDYLLPTDGTPIRAARPPSPFPQNSLNLRVEQFPSFLESISTVKRTHTIPPALSNHVVMCDLDKNPRRGRFDSLLYPMPVLDVDEITTLNVLPSASVYNRTPYRILFTENKPLPRTLNEITLLIDFDEPPSWSHVKNMPFDLVLEVVSLVSNHGSDSSTKVTVISVLHGTAPAFN